MDYSNKILIIRAKLNLSQEQLAKQLNVSFSTINRWENKKIFLTKDIDIYLILYLKNVLKG